MSLECDTDRKANVPEKGGHGAHAGVKIESLPAFKNRSSGESRLLSKFVRLLFRRRAANSSVVMSQKPNKNEPVGEDYGFCFCSREKGAILVIILLGLGLLVPGFMLRLEDVRIAYSPDSRNSHIPLGS
jgi:hypothetical protein